jgi:hypothetical protein
MNTLSIISIMTVIMTVVDVAPPIVDTTIINDKDNEYELTRRTGVAWKFDAMTANDIIILIMCRRSTCSIIAL